MGIHPISKHQQHFKISLNSYGPPQLGYGILNFGDEISLSGDAILLF